MNDAIPACLGTKRALFVPGKAKDDDQLWNGIPHLLNVKMQSGNLRLDSRNLRSKPALPKVAPHHLTRGEDSS